MRDYRELEFWTRSHNLTLEVYRLTKDFPREELYGLTSQIRRSMSSIPSNIAEGCGRSSIPDYRRFLDIAMGSASEAEYQLLLAHDLTYLKPDDYQRLSNELIEIKKMLNAYIQRLKSTS
jgi:four helix bundle protein